MTGRSLKGLCKHSEEKLDILSVVIKDIVEKNEFLAVSCWKCKYIKLINIEDPSKKPILAYEGDGVGPMWKGDEDIICTASNQKLLILGCRATQFELQRTIPVDLDNQPVQLHYIPKSDIFLLSSLLVEWGVSGAGDIIWQKSGMIDKKEFNPRGMVLVPELNSFLVADHPNQRLLVISIQDGDILQTLPVESLWIQNLHLIDDKLLIHHDSSSTVKLSYYSVSSLQWEFFLKP